MRIWEILSAEIKFDKEEDEDGDMVKVRRAHRIFLSVDGVRRCLRG